MRLFLRAIEQGLNEECAQKGSNLMKSLYSGRFSHYMICDNCGLTTTRDEIMSYFTLPLCVKDLSVPIPSLEDVSGRYSVSWQINSSNHLHICRVWAYFFRLGCC